MAKEFGRLDPEALLKTADEENRLHDILKAALPPHGMGAAPVAPARGAMRLVPEFTMAGQFRRFVGSHWVSCEGVDRINAEAELRHQRRRPDAAFTPPFSPEQVEIARDYRGMVEWRAGSPVKGVNLDAGGGGGDGLGIGYSEAFLNAGEWLWKMQARIGPGFALRPRRHLDRDNARRTIPDQMLVDLVVLGDWDLSAVLRYFGWVENGVHRGLLRGALADILDRMRGETG